ncbi:MAG: hypothetical protein ACE5K8_07075 [Candidatus Zixiibacteriota bacterium]
MKGSIILDRLQDPELKREWLRYVDILQSTLERLNKVRQSSGKGAAVGEYLEAVLQFAEARDQERNFFWDAFVEDREQA